MPFQKDMYTADSVIKYKKTTDNSTTHESQTILKKSRRLTSMLRIKPVTIRKLDLVKAM